MLGKSGETSDLVKQSSLFKWSRGSRHTIGTQKGIDLWVTFNQPAANHWCPEFILIYDLIAKMEFIVLSR